MSLCTLEPITAGLPVNCNLVVYQLSTNTGHTPVVTIERDGVQMVIPTTTVSSTATSMNVLSSQLCDGETVYETRPTDYNVLELALTGAQVGDVFWVNGYGQGGTGIIGEASAAGCPLPYAPECNGDESIDCAAYEEHAGAEDDSVGCSASPGASGLLVAVVLLGLVLGRTRRSRA